MYHATPDGLSMVSEHCPVSDTRLFDNIGHGLSITETGAKQLSTAMVLAPTKKHDCRRKLNFPEGCIKRYTPKRIALVSKKAALKSVSPQLT